MNGAPVPGAGRTGDRALGVLLECFSAANSAGRARGALDARLRAQGDVVLDTVVLRVSAKHRAAVHDPRRVVQGTLTAALTWGVFGLVAGGLKSLALWAILGAVSGGLWAYYTEHLLRKDELTRIGAALAADSSALLAFVETGDHRRVLSASGADAPVVASVAAIGDDLGLRVFAGESGPGPMRTGRNALTSMIFVRFPDTGTARQVASKVAPAAKNAAGPVRVELVIWADPGGRRHVADPSQGAQAWAKSDLVSWGLFGVIVGALAGAFGGGGTHGLVGDAVVTGVGWAVFGLLAGALYGLWAGRAVSARRLKGLSGLLVPGSSMLVAWAGGPFREDAIDSLSRPGSQRLILRFNAVDGGAVLAAD